MKKKIQVILARKDGKVEVKTDIAEGISFEVDTLEIQRQIQMDYEEDIRKYAEGLEQTKIVSVYRNVPVQLAKENKKFQLSKIDKKARSREYMGCITWLEDAGVTDENFTQMTEDAIKSGNIKVNPRKTEAKDILRLYQEAL